jgi:hypothetical protein
MVTLSCDREDLLLGPQQQVLCGKQIASVSPGGYLLGKIEVGSDGL